MHSGGSRFPLRAAILPVASVLYGILYFAAPLIALFFEEPTIILILRVLSLVLFFGAFNLIQNVILTRTMQFKKLFLSSFGAVIISSVIGITMAYTQFGVWALVGQQLSYQILFTIIIWLMVGWRPKFIFSLKRIRKLFSYGSNLLISSMLYAFSPSSSISLIKNSSNCFLSGN